MPHEWDVPLGFEVPPKYRPPTRQAVYPQWRKYSGRRTSCDDCILALVDGSSHFMAEPAKYVRIDADSKRYYCHAHAHERRWRDTQ